jgi:hypothetical protein
MRSGPPAGSLGRVAAYLFAVIGLAVISLAGVMALHRQHQYDSRSTATVIDVTHGGHTQPDMYRLRLDAVTPPVARTFTGTADVGATMPVAYDAARPESFRPTSDLGPHFADFALGIVGAALALLGIFMLGGVVGTAWLD